MKQLRNVVVLLFSFLLGQQLLAQPTISSFAPTSGPIGTTVTITGTNFSTTPANNIVYFGDVKATVTAATSTSITVAVPTGTSYEPITVTTGALTAYSSQPFIVTFPALSNVLSNSFTQNVEYTIEASPEGSCIGDLDQDGKPDLVVVNRNSKTVSVLKNTGFARNLAFASKVDYETGDNPRRVAIGDLDGDGKPDLVVANSSSNNNISIFKNTSTGGSISFAPKVDIPSNTAPIHVAIGDLDGDGKPDLVVGYWNTSPFSIFKNTSTGGSISFAPKVDIDNGSQPIHVAIGDLNGDGKPELAVTNAYNYSISVFKNTGSVGNIAFAPRVDYATGNVANSIAIGDLDGDQKPELVVGSMKVTSTSPIPPFSIFKNTSTGGSISFAPKEDFTTGSEPKFVALGDLDGDGKPDLSVIGSGDLISVFKNTSTTGRITFAPKADFNTKYGLQSITIGDLDIDGHLDLSVVSVLNTVSVLRNLINEPPLITSFTPVTAGSESEITITGKYLFNATAVSIGGVAASSFSIVDSSTIKAVVGSGASGSVSVTSPNGSGSLPGFTFTTSPIFSSFTPKFGGVGTEITITGHNLTGTTAVSFGGVAASSFMVISPTTIKAIVGTGASGSVSITTPGGILSSAGFSFTPLPVITSFTPAFGPVGTTVTIQGGNFDVLPANNTVYFGASKANVSAASSGSLTVTAPIGATYQPISVTTGNFTTYSDKPYAVTFPGIGAAFASNSFGPFNSYPSGDYPTEITRGDLDGDGKLDLVVVNHNSKTVSIFRNTSSKGAISFASKIDIATIYQPWEAAISDLDGDGKPELVVTGSGVVSVYRNTGTPGSPAFAPRINLSFTNSSTFTIDVAIRDLNGDGKPDIAVLGSSLVLFRNTGSTGTISFDSPAYYNVGGGAQCLVIDDWNIDGKADIATGNMGDNLTVPASITIYKNSGWPGAPFFASDFSRTDYTLGLNRVMEDIQSGDLDGDGKPELAVTVNQTSSVNIYKNTSTSDVISFAASVGFPTGTVPYAVSLEDLDGDGKPDLAVANFSNGDVSVLKNKSTVSTVSFAPHEIYYSTINGQFVNICTGDLDGDGKPDIALSDYYKDAVVVLRNTVAEAKVVPSGTNPVSGFVANKVTVDPSVQTFFGTPYVQRHYDIEPANTPSTATATVTLYFTQQEFDNYNAHPGHGLNLPTGPSDAAGIAALRVYQYHGLSTSSVPGSYSGSVVEINPDDPKIVWNATAQWWEVTFDVNGFSGFFIGSNGSTMAGCSAVSGGTANIPPDAFCASGSTTLSATGYTGTGVSYQWQYSNDNFATDVHDLAGQTNPASAASGTVTATTYYRLKVSCAIGTATAYSTVVTFTKNTPPSITTQPADRVVCTGSATTFTVAATGSNLTFQWRKAGANISGANAASYTITSVVANDAGLYDVVVSGACGSTTSSVASLTINTAPAITTQPAAQTACANSGVTFTVAATGSGLAYQWRKNGANINGATNSSYTISSVTAADVANYDVVVSGSCSPSVTSSVAALSLAPATWLGATSSDWNTASNWCGGVPSQASSITIPSGTQYPAVITGTADVGNLSIASGATLTVNASGTLNLYGNLAGSGNLVASTGTVAFRGTAGQTVPSIAAANVVMNGTGGVTLMGNLTVGSALTLTNGKITLGAYNLTTASVVTGSPSSYIVTNGSGSLTIKNVGTSSVVFPVGSSATSVNPVVVSNGSGRDFSVRVASGINPSVLTPASAINRTWSITPSAASPTPASLSFGYVDADANASANPAANMEVGVHDGSKWTIITPAGGVNPVSASGARTVTTASSLFGTFVLGNLNVVTAIPRIDPDVAGIVVMPNIIRDNSVIRVSVKKAMKIEWTITDMNGRVVMKFGKQVSAGQTDIALRLGYLPQGTYYLHGTSKKRKHAGDYPDQAVRTFEVKSIINPPFWRVFSCIGEVPPTRF